MSLQPTITRNLLYAGIGFAAGACIAGVVFSGPKAADSKPTTSSSASPGFATNAQSGGSSTEPSSLADAPTTDKEAKLFGAFRDPNDMRRISAMYDAANALTLEEIPGLIAKIRSMPPDAREALMPVVLARWAQFDPKAAGDYLITLKDRNGRD